jgi:hypothetical protein
LEHLNHDGIDRFSLLKKVSPNRWIKYVNNAKKRATTSLKLLHLEHLNHDGIDRFSLLKKSLQIDGLKMGIMPKKEPQQPNSFGANQDGRLIVFPHTGMLSQKVTIWRRKKS